MNYSILISLSRYFCIKSQENGHIEAELKILRIQRHFNMFHQKLLINNFFNSVVTGCSDVYSFTSSIVHWYFALTINRIRNCHQNTLQ